MATDLEASILVKVLDAFSGPLKKLDGQLEELAAQGKRTANALSIEHVGKVADSIIGPVKGAVQEFASFEKEMSKVAALSGEIGTEGFGKMREQALELGAATAYSSEEAAQAMAQYAQAGRSVNEILAVTPLTLAAAKANGTGLAETAAIIGHTMSGMGIATSDTARVVDVLTAGAAASDMSLSDMGQALAYVGPVARQSGMSLELTAAYMGKLKDAGLEASSVGTGMRAVISRLLDPSKEATKAFSKLGFTTKELATLQQNVASGKIDVALKAIGEAAEKLPNEKRMALLSQIFGMEASTAASVAITASLDVSPTGVRNLEEQLKSAGGTAERLAFVMEDNLSGSMERASGAVGGLSTQIGEILAPSAKDAATGVESLANWCLGFVKENPNFTKAILKFALAIGGIALALKAGMIASAAYVTTQGVVIAAYRALQAQAITTSTVMSGAALKMAGGVVAAAALGYAIGTLVNDWLELDDKISNLLGKHDPLKDRRQKQPGFGDGTQVYADGTEIDQFGNVKLGKGGGRRPKRVQEAMAAGARTDEEISAYVRGKQQDEARALFARGRAQGGLLRRDDIGKETTFNAVTGQTSGFGRDTKLGAGGRVESFSVVADALKQQTERTVKAVEANEKATRDLLAEQKAQRPRAGAPTGGGLAGQGAF